MRRCWAIVRCAVMCALRPCCAESNSRATLPSMARIADSGQQLVRRARPVGEKPPTLPPAAIVPITPGIERADDNPESLFAELRAARTWRLNREHSQDGCGLMLATVVSAWPSVVTHICISVAATCLLGRFGRSATCSVAFGILIGSVLESLWCRFRPSPDTYLWRDVVLEPFQFWRCLDYEQVSGIGILRDCVWAILFVAIPLPLCYVAWRFCQTRLPVTYTLRSVLAAVTMCALLFALWRTLRM